MDASHISKDLYNWIQIKEQLGKVHSIFKSVINILSEDGRFIALVINNKPMSPNSIRLSENMDFTRLDIKIGSKVSFKKYYLSISNMNIYYKDSQVWDESIKLVDSKDTYENIKLKLDIIKQFILDKGNRKGIFSLMKYISSDLSQFEDSTLENGSHMFIKDRFISFINAFRNYELNIINSYSKKIIGFGPGLTPSMDDFISGLMISNIYIYDFLAINIEKAYRINQEIISDIENRTTRVSEEMLKQSSLGETNEDIRDLMVAIIGNNHKEELEHLMEKVIDYGHSSGTDILCGIYAGIYILIKAYKGSQGI